ncbi:MAG: 2-phospho-L-lactate guanylyltransferase [Anaerolineaceae bacterium]|nr:2-phospho-L-lactate guanylyltransferase [Anaerolineaceae bacterium]
MSLWAIVPVKPLRRGKSRLAGVLTEEERTQLNFSMLSHTLKVLASVPEIYHTLVVSRDPAALALARDHGAKTLLEDGNPHLNTALRRATAVAQAYSAEGVLIVPADLPLLAAEDVQSLISRMQRPPVVVIASDRRAEGTNALLVSPAGLIEYGFGSGSFQRHCDRTTKFCIRLEVVENPAIALDLDLPEDLEMLRKMDAFQLDIENSNVFQLP